MRDQVKRIGHITEEALLILCGICFLSCLITGALTGKPSIFGFRPFYVITDSMEPTIRAHSLVLAVPIDSEDVEAGDIITYTREAADTGSGHFHICFTVVHRVREIRENIFIFQGDNESEPDPLVIGAQIGYKVIWGAVKRND